jgi:hypothetical protein
VSLLEIALLWTIGFFVVCQIFNAIMNILTARYLRKRAILEAKLKEEELRHLFDDIQKIHIVLHDFQYATKVQLEIIDDFMKGRTSRSPPKIIRGKYKPRKKKEIELKTH